MFNVAKTTWSLIVLAACFVGLLAYGGSLWLSFISQEIVAILKVEDEDEDEIPN